jgi:hypothetical protein
MAEYALRYLRDHLRIFVRDRIDGAPYGGAPFRLSGDDRKLIRELLDYLEAQYEARQRGGEAARGKSGRPRLPDNEISPAAKYQRERRAKRGNK